MSIGAGKKRSFAEIVDLSVDDENNDLVDTGINDSSALKPAELLNRNSSMIEFQVFVTPEVLERHRQSTNGHFYNPSKGKQEAFLAQCQGFFIAGPFKGPVEVSLVFYFKRPLYHYGTGRNSNILKPNSDVWHTKTKGVLRQLI